MSAGQNEPTAAPQEPGTLDFAFGGLSAYEEESAKCWLLQGGSDYLSHHRQAWESALEDEDRGRLSSARSAILQEVRALLARWLRMQNLVVLTGAGTSMCAGGRRGDGLLSGAQALLAGRPTGDTLSQLLQGAIANPNFEEFLSYLSAARRCLQGAPNSLQQPFHVMLPDGMSARNELHLSAIDALLTDLEAAIAVMCALKLPVQSLAETDGQLNPHLAFAGKIVSRDPRLNRVKLCTLSYDTLFEQAMDLMHVIYADGFTGRTERVFNPASFDLDYYFPGQVAEGRVRRYDKFLHLYKLHGSVDWRKSETTPENVHGVTWCGKAQISESDILGGRASLDQVFAGHCCAGEAPSSKVGLAILPTSAKYGETIAMPYAHLFRAFAQATQEPNTVLFVLGYSGWDRHVNLIIEEALANPSFTLVLVNTSLGEWAKNMLRSDRCQRVYAAVGEWGKFERFAVDLLPDVEQLETQIEVARQLRDIRRTTPSTPTDEGGELL